MQKSIQGTSFDTEYAIQLVESSAHVIFDNVPELIIII